MLRQIGAVPRACALFLVLALGCERQWYLDVMGSGEPGFPEFCASREPGCGSPGVSLAQVYFDRIEIVGPEGDREMRREPVWRIRAVEDRDLARFHYGAAPEGWTETMPARALEIGMLYEASGRFFRLAHKGSETVGERVENPWHTGADLDTTD